MERICKLQIITYFIFSTMFSSCDENQDRELKPIGMRTNNYQSGDCFRFKEKINDFGVVFIKDNIGNDQNLLNFFPVKLDTTKQGIEQFKFGKVYLSSFLDFTNSTGKTEGFMVYVFVGKQDFKSIDTLFRHIGNIEIAQKYCNATGGGSAFTIDEFRKEFDHWDNLFGHQGRKVSMTEILE